MLAGCTMTTDWFMLENTLGVKSVDKEPFRVPGASYL